MPSSPIAVVRNFIRPRWVILLTEEIAADATDRKLIRLTHSLSYSFFVHKLFRVLLWVRSLKATDDLLQSRFKHPIR